MKKKNEELEEKCMCGCNEECTCGDNCECTDECTCGCSCGCDEECDCCELPALEEKLVLVGNKSDKKTKEAIKKLDDKKLNYSFVDLETETDERFIKLKEDIQVPSLLLVQTIVAGVASGLNEIEEAINE